jgi:hypothetical protein
VVCGTQLDVEIHRRCYACQSSKQLASCIPYLPKRRYEMRREGNKLERGEVKTLPVDLLSRGHHASHYNRLQYAIFSVKANRPVISFGSFIPTSFSFLHTYKYISMVSCCTLFFTKWPYINTANAKRVVHSQIQMPSPSVTATLQPYDSHLTTSERERAILTLASSSLASGLAYTCE